MGKTLDQALAVLNGAIGDYLVREGNGLATEMTLVHDYAPIANEKAALARAYPSASSRIVVLVHGLMCTETIWDFPDGSPDYGARLTKDCGVSALYVRYNSGRAIADNGLALHGLLESLVAAWPVPVSEIVPLGFSMGGLVIRSACHVASEESAWLPLVKRALYAGTPHLGAPLERAGRVLARLLEATPDPYTQLIADLANLRSDGVKDLGDADLRHDDRARRVASFSLRDARHPVPLLPSIRHYLAAGSLSIDPRLATLFGDVMVPVPSATDGAVMDAATLAIPPDHVRIYPGLAHMTMAHHEDVYRSLLAWCSEA